MDKNHRVNVGCGPTPLPGYVNIDVDEKHFEDLTAVGRERLLPMVHDVTKGLPFSDRSMTEVRADQFLEHLDPQQAVRFLAEAYRVLVNRGELRLSFPDIGAVAAGVPQGHLDKWQKTIMRRFPAEWPDDMAFLNLVASHWGHLTVLTTRGVVEMVGGLFRVIHHGVNHTTGYVVATKGNAPNAWRTSGG